MYVWVGCSFSMDAKMSIINYLIRLSNSCKCMESMEKPYWGSGSEMTYVQGFLHPCSHSLVPRLPLSGTQICGRESLVSFLTWAWCNQNSTRVFRTEDVLCVVQPTKRSMLGVYDIRLPIASLGPKPKTNPSADCFQYSARHVILEAIYALDEVWGRDKYDI